MSWCTTAILPFAISAAVGVIVFASAGRWDLPFVWAILGTVVCKSEGKPLGCLGLSTVFSER